MDDEKLLTSTVSYVPGVALYFHCSENVFAFQYNPICGYIQSESRDGNKNTNITLLSICDLPALHPPSECSATMERSKGEGGRLPLYSGIYWWYTSSRIADSIQRIEVWERLQTHLQDILHMLFRRKGFS